jgi:hypothetical protein
MRAQLRHPLVDRPAERRRVAHVRRARHHAPPHGSDALHGLREVVGSREPVLHRVGLRADVDRDDVGALLREPDRVAATLPARRAGDERDLPVEATHGPNPTGDYGTVDAICVIT